MEKFTTLTATAAPFTLVNVDTDMIMPKQHLKTIKRTGLGKFTFSDMRYLDDGAPNPDFVLNKPEYAGARILVTGANFGCGSSREHAPWGLADMGIRCLIGPSFADIFYNNCFKNGMLPIVVPEDVARTLAEDAQDGVEFTVDLEAQTITTPARTISFDIDTARRHNLLGGLDDIGLTLENLDAIRAFEEKQAREQPWLA